MHIVIDGIIYGLQGWGGINTYFNELLPRLTREDGIEVDLLVPRRARGELPTGNLRRETRRLFSPGAGLGPGRKGVLNPLIHRISGALTRLPGSRWGKPHIFHSSYFTRSEAPGAVQVATAYDLNHEHFPEMYESPWGRWLRAQYRRYLTQADRIIAISHKTKRDLLDFYPIDPSRVDVIPLAVNASDFFPDPGNGKRNEGRPFLLYVGGRRAYKNFSFLLRGLLHSKIGKNLELRVVGEEWLPEEQNLIRELGLAGRVRWMGRPSVPALRRLYSDAVALIYPSLHEGFALPLLEAMACGTTVLASDTDISREIAGEAAAFFDPTDVESLGAALEFILQPERRALLVANGRRRTQEFSWDTCARQTLATYRSALRGRPV